MNPTSTNQHDSRGFNKTVSLVVYSYCELAAEKYPGNRMLGWREVIKGKRSRVGIYGANCPQWAVAMEQFFYTGVGAIDYIIEHAEIDVAFVQDKKVKQKDAAASVFGIKAYSWNDFVSMDLVGKPLMRWNDKGEHVSMLTFLPSWKCDKVTHHAGAVMTALYGRKNLEALRDIPPLKLSAMVAQAQASMVMSHFMGCAFLPLALKGDRKTL
ncbi:Long chain acyl-CoA synthetase 1 [Platanthera guangdongensis]|uniref:Long chain acyl-CoA synthetase 1 n=1 Tax=Platanthera guangdongensis TaxID=2320717 RepID=A0ABR2LPP6_9ASPA